MNIRSNKVLRNGIRDRNHPKIRSMMMATLTKSGYLVD